MGRTGHRGIGTLAAWALAEVSALAAGCDRDLGDRRGPRPTAAPCERAFGDKLGVPFVRVCPADLVGAIEAPFWISAAPVGCTAGAHGTLSCPPVLPLGPRPLGASRIAPRTAQVTEAAFAHRTCALRFGGRLPTITERAQARDALGLSAVVVTESSDPSPRLSAQALAEWTTERPCDDAPAALATSCAPTRFPSGAIAEVPWPQLRACHASPAPAAGALIVEVGESCPNAGVDAASPRCLLALPAATGPQQAFALDCRALTEEEAIHPDGAMGTAGTAGERAAFRCVVPESALVGTTTAP